MFHLKSWPMVTPSNLALVTNSRGLPFRTRGSKSWLLLENPIRSSLHLASFSWNPEQELLIMTNRDVCHHCYLPLSILVNLHLVP